MPPASHQPPVRPFLGLAFGILAVSTAAIFIRYAQQDAPSLVVAAYRLTLASLFLLPLALTGRREELRTLGRKDLALALLSGFFLALHFATWITSLEFTSVASSVVLVSTAPLWVALISPFTLKEPLRRLAILGMSLALIGGITVGLSDACSLGPEGLVCTSLENILQGKAVIGDLLALAGAINAAAYLLLGRRLRAKMSLVGYVFIAYGMAAVIMILFVLLARQPILGYPPRAYLWFFLLALVPQLLGHSTFNWALRYFSAAFVSISLLGEPIGSTILAYFLLQEAPGLLKIFGAILILVGIYVASLSEAT